MKTLRTLDTHAPPRKHFCKVAASITPSFPQSYITPFAKTAPPTMAPSSQPYFQKDEKALCFHHELLYEAKVLDVKQVDPNDKKSAYQYKVHYKGWKAT